jgi:uncharacterized protein (TIGR03083 family)
MIMLDASAIDALTHDEAMDLQTTELQRTIGMLRSLSDEEWTAQTECPDWDVRAMYAHVLGACEAGASMRENMHQMRVARSHRKSQGGPLEAALSNVQVRERADLTPTEIVERLEATAPKTIKGRRRLPAVVRKHAKLAIDGPVHETWSLGYLVDTIYLRDVWMHRVDVSEVTSHELELSPEHDGRIVADVVREWAGRHGQAFSLELTGPAGGSFGSSPESSDAESVTLDAVDFCRALAGRIPAAGLLSTVVPF